MTESARRRWSFPLVRVAGIQIRVHITFFLLVPLFAWAGTQGDGPGALGALVWLIVIFGCVVLHELGHCFVARRHGVDVHEIDLLPIGGVSKLERLPERGRDEFAIAVAGPVVSGLIAAGSALIATLATIPLTPVDWFGGPIVTRLVWFNLLIGAFNLLPAFPPSRSTEVASCARCSSEHAAWKTRRGSQPASDGVSRSPWGCWGSSSARCSS